jgi:hypothetical protein
VAAPGGFDPLNPDLDNLFNVVLPFNVAPVYEQTMAPTVALTIPAYNLVMTWESVLHLRAEAVLFDFGPSTETAALGISILTAREISTSENAGESIFRVRIIQPATVVLDAGYSAPGGVRALLQGSLTTGASTGTGALLARVVSVPIIGAPDFAIQLEVIRAIWTEASFGANTYLAAPMTIEAIIAPPNSTSTESAPSELNVLMGATIS